MEIKFSLSNDTPFQKGKNAGLTEQELVEAAIDLSGYSPEQFAALATLSRASRVLAMTDVTHDKSVIDKAVAALQQQSAKITPYYIQKRIQEQSGIRLDHRTIRRYLAGHHPEIIAELAANKGLSFNEYVLSLSTISSD